MGKNKEYEVLIVGYATEVRELIDGEYRLHKDGIGFDLDYILKNGGTIYSVKRLSDGEIFTIDDLVRYKETDSCARITNITEFQGKIHVDFGRFCPELKDIQKVSEKNSEIAQESYDFINPNHYKSFSKEVIDMMIDIWGKEAVAIHCEITAFKYKMRIGSKPDQPIERDLEKANWYLAKAKELKNG